MVLQSGLLVGLRMLIPSLLVVPLGRAPLVGPTAAVERAHSDRARSGSNGLTGVSFRPFVLVLSCISNR